MDGSQFGLTHRPFSATADSECYYPATSHERALAKIAAAVLDGEGLALLTGDVGLGKTLICHQLLERLGPEVTAVFLTNTHVRDRAGLLQAVLYDLSLPYEGLTEQELRLKLTDALLKSYAQGRRTLLLVDEAQLLTADLLEELRLWGNLEARGRKAVQIVLVAHTRIAETLRQPKLESLCQRLVTRAHLEALSPQESADYIVHHLRAAGGHPEKILSDEALEILARGAHGVPRLLNQACQQALTLAATTGAHSVDAEAALEALAQLGLVEDMTEPSPPKKGARRADETSLNGKEPAGKNGHLPRSEPE